MNPFHLYNGEQLNNAEDLRRALNSMEEHAFHHHVNAQKNDFADWIEGSLKNKALADKLRRTKSIRDMQVVLDGYDAPNKKTQPKKKSSKKKTASKKTEKKEEEKQMTEETAVLEKKENPIEELREKRKEPISTEAPHKFILKEFLFGALFGLILGLILAAMLVRAGFLY